jgi:antimicrobial peptide system SdpB family protein
LSLAKLVAVFLLTLVASGWRPRVTGVLHWWLAWSVFTAITIPDGGDQITAVITLLLLPLTLTDTRRWHWTGPSATKTTTVQTLIALSSLIMVRIQVASVYLDSAIGKLGVREWANGTAMYYWLSHPSFGAAGLARSALQPSMRTALGVTMLTWGTIGFELLLAAGYLLPPRIRKWLFVSGIVFHIGIGFIMGLMSFGIAMVGALVLYLAPISVTSQESTLGQALLPTRIRRSPDCVDA